MGDLILFVFLIGGTYLCGAVFTILVFRSFFPFTVKTVKGEVKIHEMTLTYSKTKTQSSTKDQMHLLSVDRRR